MRSAKRKKEFLTADELALRLRCHVETIRRYARDGKIPFGRIGRKYRFPVEVVGVIRDQWLDMEVEDED